MRIFNMVNFSLNNNFDIITWTAYEIFRIIKKNLSSHFSPLYIEIQLEIEIGENTKKYIYKLKIFFDFYATCYQRIL